jgi:hypothetical protein
MNYLDLMIFAFSGRGDPGLATFRSDPADFQSELDWIECSGASLSKTLKALKKHYAVSMEFGRRAA